jgi:hypothetical protein
MLMRSTAVRIVLHSLVACALVSPCRAAENPKPAAKPDVSATKSDDAWYRLVYVPYRAIKTILDDPKATAIVPLQEYLRLWESGGPGVRPAPLGAVVTESHYVAKVEKDVVRIQATLTVQSLEKNWSEAAVRFGEAAIGKITSENNRLLVRGLGRGAYALLVPAAGTYKVEMELATPVRTSPDGRSFDFDCPTVGITTFELSIPESDQTVELSPQAIVQPSDSKTGVTRIKANLASTPRITARWRPRVGTRPEMELLAGVENVLHVTIGEGVVHTDASLTYKVFRGELGQLRVAVPSGDRILDVSSPQGAIRSWRAVNESNRQLVSVDLLSPVSSFGGSSSGGSNSGASSSSASKEITLDVHTERPLPADGFDVAGIDDKGRPYGIHAIDVVRESGELVLSHGAGMDVTVESEKGLVRLDSGEVPALFRKPDSSFYKFYSPAVRLRLEARPVEPQVAVFQQSQLVFSDDDLRLTSNLRYDVTRTGLFELLLKIPDGLSIDSVESPAIKAFHVSADSHQLAVTLNEKQTGTIELTVKGRRELGGRAEVDLPLLEPLNAFREDGLVAAYVPEGMELASDESKLTGAHPEPPGNAAAPPATYGAGTWSYHRRPVAIRVKTVRKPTRLTARIGTTVSVQQESASVVAQVDFAVENAGIDTFRIALPEAVADKAQFDVAAGQVGVKQQSRDEKAVDGWVAWTISLQQKVTGQHRFVVKYDLNPTVPPPPPPKAGEQKAAEQKAGEQKGGEPGKAEFVVALPQPLGLKNADGTDRVALARIEGEAAVLEDRSLSVAAEATGGDVEPIDVRELKQLNQNAYLAYRYEKQPVKLKLGLVRYGVQEVVETVVSRALVEVVVGRDASALYRCRYRLKTSQRQRLPLDLPSGSSPLGVFLDGKQISLETNPTAAKAEGWTSYFVNVARSKASDEPLVLAVQFRRPVTPAPFESPGGFLLLALPRLGGAGSERVVVQQLRTAIWVPEKYALVQTPEGFVPESRTRQSVAALTVNAAGPGPGELENWIGDSRAGLFEFPHEGNGYVYRRLGPADSIRVTWWNMPLYTLVISLAIAIIVWLLRRSRWETAATFILTAALVGTLAALIDRELVWHVLLAARYGLLALVILWLIEGFRRRSAQTPRGTQSSSSASTFPPGVVIPPPGIFDTLVTKGD